MRPANEWRRYIVTSSLIGWAHAKNGPWIAVTGDISVSHTSWTCTTHITVTSHEHPAVSYHLEFHASTSLLRLTSIYINITAPHERLLVSGVHRWPVDYPYKGPVMREVVIMLATITNTDLQWLRHIILECKFDTTSWDDSPSRASCVRSVVKVLEKVHRVETTPK